MGFERVEDPSQVEGSALVGLGKIQSSRASFAVGKRARIPPKEPRMGFERVEDPSQVEDSALVGLGKAQSSRASFAVGKRARIPPKKPPSEPSSSSRAIPHNSLAA